MLSHEERLFLNMAETSGLLNPTQASQAESALRAAREQGNPTTIWDMLVHWGYLSQEQAYQVFEVARQAMAKIQTHEMTAAPPPGPPSGLDPVPPPAPPAAADLDAASWQQASQTPQQGHDPAAAYPGYAQPSSAGPPAVPSLTGQPPGAGQYATYPADWAPADSASTAIPEDPAAPPAAPLGRRKRPGRSAALRVKLKKRASHKTSVRRLIVIATVAAAALVVGILSRNAILRQAHDKQTEAESERLARASARRHRPAREPELSKRPDSEVQTSTSPEVEKPPGPPPSRPQSRPPGAPRAEIGETRPALGEAEEPGEEESRAGPEPGVAAEPAPGLMRIRTAAAASLPAAGSTGTPSVASTDTRKGKAGTRNKRSSKTSEMISRSTRPRGGILELWGQTVLPVRAWKALGPFGHPKLKDRPDAPAPSWPAHNFVCKVYQQATYPPDSLVDLDAVFRGGLTRDVAGLEHEISWTDFRLPLPEEEPKLRDFVVQYPRTETLAKAVGLTYFSTWINVPEQTELTAIFPAYGKEAQVDTKSGASVRAWFNGEPVAHEQIHPENRYLQHPVQEQPVVLRAGSNHVYAKVCSTWSGARMALILKGDVERLEKLKISANPPRSVGHSFTIAGEKRVCSRTPAPEGVVRWLTAEPTASKLPEDAAEFGGHYYKVFQKKVSWTSAWKACGGLGGSLVCIGSKEENDFVAGLIGDRKAWIGGTDEEQEGVWKWVNGDDLTYTKWAMGGPRNVSGNEDYLYMTTDGQWVSAPKIMLGALDRFVCEWEKQK